MAIAWVGLLLIPAACALSAEPIWAGHAGARYALLRRSVPLPATAVASAIIHVTAAQSGTMEKLLGAYRLYVGGAAVGVGPGRGGARTAAYADGGDLNHTYYDTFNVTARVQATTRTLILGLQCYHETGDASAGEPTPTPTYMVLI